MFHNEVTVVMMCEEPEDCHYDVTTKGCVWQYRKKVTMTNMFQSYVYFATTDNAFITHKLQN